MARSELAQRVAVAAVGIPVVLSLGYLGGWPLGALLAGAAALGASELYSLAHHRGVRPFTVAGSAAAAVVVLLVVPRPTPASAAPLLWSFLLLLALVLGVASIWLRGADGRPLVALATTLFGVLYLGGTLLYGLLLRHLPDALPLDPGATGGSAWAGTALLFFPILLTWVNDSCAFAIGRRWGRRRLIPAVSPGKTIAGAVAGLVGTAVVSAGYAAVVLHGWQVLPIGAWTGAAGGVVVSVAAQLGDLVESVLKREAGVKDSGRLLPGHGGVLDRVDALLFTLPVAYWYLSIVLTQAPAGVAWP